MVDHEHIVLIVDGGIGKNICATVVVRNLKKKFKDKKISVVAGYPDIFLNNQHIYKIFNFGNPLYFYDDFIKNSTTRVIKVEPYLHPDYLYKKRHLSDVWCEMVGVECDSIKPDISLLSNEHKAAELYLTKFKKPIILMQYIGGMNPDQATPEERIKKESSMFRRSIPKHIAQAVVNKLKDKYDIILAKSPNQEALDGAEVASFPIRSVMAMIPHIDKFILIDSFLQHAVAAFNKKALVCWGGTSPTCLGYDTNNNMLREACDTPFCHRPNSFVFDIQPHGFLWDCPNADACMNFDADEIVAKVEETV